MISNSKRIIKNSTFQGFALGVQAITAFVIPVILARMSGAELLGEFSFLITLIGFFSIISTFGLPSLLTREIARIKEDVKQVNDLIDASLGMVIVLSIIAVFLMIVIGLILGVSKNSLLVLIITGIGLSIESMASVLAASFRGIEEFEWSSAIHIVMDLVFLLLVLVLVLLNARIDVLMIAYLISRIVSIVVAVKLYRPRFGSPHPEVNLKQWRTLFKTGAPFAINKAFAVVYVRIDVLILAFLTSTTAVGVYEAATNLTMRTNMLAWTVNFAIYPLVSALYYRDRHQAYGYTAKTIQFLMIPGFFIAIIVWVFARDITMFLYGDHFLDAVNAMKLLALIVPLRFIDTSLSVSLNASNRQGKTATAVVVAATVNLIMNFVLIPTYQMMGAVYATIITEIVLFLLLIWYLRSNIGELINWRIFIGPGLAVVTILWVYFFFNSTHTILSIVFYTLLYLSIIAVIDHSSIKSLRVILAKG